MSQLAKAYYTPEEYLRMEENSLEKHEYYQGEIFLMAGGSPRHNLIANNCGTELNVKLAEKDCTVYSSDMKMWARSNGFFTYADASVVCGEVELVPEYTDILANPIMIVEVLSPSTEKYDRSQKFELYRGLDSLQSYLLVDQSRVYVEHHQKIGPNKWVMETFTDLEQFVEVEALGISLSMGNLYRKVKFDKTA
jgi:Uma2 family endonuclease